MKVAQVYAALITLIDEMLSARVILCRRANWVLLGNSGDMLSMNVH